MRKLYLILFIFVLVNIGGCEKSSDSFLSYEIFKHPIGTSGSDNLTENSFFAEDLLVLPKENFGDEDYISSEAAMLINITNRDLIYSKNVYEKAYPASLTKLLTALVAIQQGETDDLATISYEAAHISETGAKLCGFEDGDIISLEELLHCILIYSGNDAAIGVAELIGGSIQDFNIMMNEEARRLGAVHYNFTNSHGLHNDDHYTSLYDMYLVFNEFIKYDYLTQIIGMSSYTTEYEDKDGNPKELSMNSTNQYFSGDIQPPEGITILGGKTGNTYKAGNCLILLCQDWNNDYYISVVLKAADINTLYSESNKLLSLIANENIE